MLPKKLFLRGIQILQTLQFGRIENVYLENNELCMQLHINCRQIKKPQLFTSQDWRSTCCTLKLHTILDEQ